MSWPLLAFKGLIISLLMLCDYGYLKITMDSFIFVSIDLIKDHMDGHDASSIHLVMMLFYLNERLWYLVVLWRHALKGL